MLSYPPQPDEDLDPVKFPAAHISKQGVRIGETMLDSQNHDPAYIIQHGVEVRLGDSHNFNVVTISFCVGQITVDDDAKVTYAD